MGYEISPLNLVKKGYISDATPPASQSLSALPRGCSSSSRQTNLSCWPGIFPTCQDPFNHRHKGTVGPLGLPGYWGETRAPGHSTAPSHESLPGHLQHQNPLLSSNSSLQQRVLRRHTHGEAAQLWVLDWDLRGGQPSSCSRLYLPHLLLALLQRPWPARGRLWAPRTSVWTLGHISAATSSQAVSFVHRCMWSEAAVVLFRLTSPFLSLSFQRKDSLISQELWDPFLLLAATPTETWVQDELGLLTE